MEPSLDQPNESAPRSRASYLIYCAAIAAALFALKLTIARDVPATAMFSDDYSYLNKSIYYVRGDWSMRGYIFQNIFAGVVYPYLISPWMLIDGGPLPRIYFVFALNALLSALTVFLGSLAITRANQQRSWYAPICLAAFAPLFLMSFVVLTENLVFPLLAIAAWLFADVERLLHSRRRVLLLLFVVGLLPLVRAPGLAVGIGACATLFLSVRRNCWKRPAVISALVLLAMVLPYLLVMYFAPTISKADTDKREAKYLRTVGDILTDPDRWWALTKVLFSQLSYITIATAGWGITVIVAYLLPSKTVKKRRDLTSLCWFCVFSAAGFLAFACLHIGKKIKFDPAAADFVFGRYDDPAALLILLAALATLPFLRKETLSWGARITLRVVTPIALLCAVAHVLEPRWATFNQTGLAAFCRHPAFDAFTLLAGVVGFTLLLQIPMRSRWFTNGLAIVLIFWSAFGIRQAFLEYIFPRSERIAISQEAATWLHDNAADSVRVGFDRRMFKQESPTWGFMGLHYQALVFGIYPREFGFARTDEDLQQYDYLFTATTRTPTPDLPVAWKNKHYVLYQVVPDAKVYSSLVPKPLRTPAARDLIDQQEQERLDRQARGLPVYTEDDVVDLRGLSDSCCTHHLDLSRVKVEPWEVWQGNNRLTMAFPSSTAELPVLVYAPGEHYLVIKATGDGCVTDPPRLNVLLEGATPREYSIKPDQTSCYVYPLPNEPVEARVRLIFVNDGRCDDDANESIDKNIFIESIEFVSVDRLNPELERSITP